MGKYLLVLLVAVFVGACWRIASTWGKPMHHESPVAPKNEQRESAPLKTIPKKENSFSICVNCDDYVMVAGHGFYRKGDQFIDGSTVLSWSGKSVLVRTTTGQTVLLYARNPAEILQEWQEEEHKRMLGPASTDVLALAAGEGK